MISDSQKERTKEDLQEIVDDFNKKFAQWMDKTGCRADFGWIYREIKGLEIRSITFDVYQKPPPEGIGRFRLDSEVPS